VSPPFYNNSQTKTTVVKRFFACRMCDHPTSVLHFNLPKQACTKYVSFFCDAT
jgi:hypothetical protein